MQQEPKFTSKDLAEQRKRFAQVSESVRGGLRHRIDRTMYYANLLDQRTEDLRIRRIPGWQTYDEYIRRIFNPQFENYGRIGKRIEEIERSLADADEVLETRIALRFNSIGIAFAALTAFALLGQAMNVPLSFSSTREIDLWRTAQFYSQAVPALLVLIGGSIYLRFPDSMRRLLTYLRKIKRKRTEDD